MTQLMQFMIGTIWVGTFTLFGYGWWQFQRFGKIGTVSLHYEQRRPVPWGLVDLILILLAVILGQAISGAISFAILGEDSIEEMPIAWMGIAQLALLVTWAAVMVAMHVRCQFPGTDLGLTFQPRDIALGAFAFGMLAVPMFALQAFLSQFVDKHHPLIESLLEDSSNLFFVVGGFAAVVVAPVVEEFLFRVFLQGWLENLASYRQAVREGVPLPAGYGVGLFWGLSLAPGPTRQANDFSSQLNGIQDADRIQESVDVPVADLVKPASDSSRFPIRPIDNPAYCDPLSSNPSLSSSGANDLASPPQFADRTLLMKPAMWPILVSSAVFAAAHIGHGPDPIPLFILALGLGFLYQRTHRVWPCIVVHCMLNFVSLFNLWFMVNTPEIAEQLLK